VQTKQVKIRILREMTGEKGHVPMLEASLTPEQKEEYEQRLMIAKQREQLVKLGYDTSMVFVNTSKEVAMARNEKRARKVDPKLVEKFWNDVQNNMGKFQALFGSNNFIIIDNNNVSQDMLDSAFVAVRKFVNRPVTSRIAQEWLKVEKQTK